ncbi:MAG: sodium:proline symporter [Candidatus Riflebacteria bacterium]|nr:sodium:proline symporter [Candidatus Riflebacteria bacterium]
MNLWIDGLVILTYFAVVIGVGLTKGSGEKTMEGFAIGDRQIPWWAVLASILAAEVSAATFLGAPGEGFALRNFTYAQLSIGTVLGRIIISFLFIKAYFDYRVVSIYEFLQIRFGTVTKNAASAIFLLTRVLASGTRLYVAAVILVLGWEMSTGQKPTAGQELLIYVAALALLTLLTALYTAAGGIKAVVWTDVIQASVMFSSIIFSIFYLLHQIPNGWNGALAKLTQPGDLCFFRFETISEGTFWSGMKKLLETEYTIWAAVLGATFLTMATHGTDQDMVQRMLTAKDHQRSRLALILSGLADLPVVLGFLLVGILLYVFYQYNPDPNLPTQNPRVFAYFILRELPMGIRGLLIAGLFATAMGSLSTAINALATSFTRDWYLPYINPSAEGMAVVRAARWATAAFAVILVAVGSITSWVVIMVPGSRIIPIVLGIFGYTYGSLLGVFLVGMVTKTRGNDRGNLLAMLCGFLVVLILSGLLDDILKLLGLPPGPWFNILPVIAFPWRIFFGAIVTFFVGIFFSTPKEVMEKTVKHLETENTGIFVKNS